MSKKVQLGIIGLGNMGSLHCRSLKDFDNITLAAICDIEPERLAKMKGRYPVPGFTNAKALIDSGICDAVLIATPHYDHTTIGITALRKGLHVMVEKPLSVHKADAIKLIAAHKDENQVFAAMFNQRTNPAYQAIRELLHSGKLGDLRRVQWTITDWFRSQAYYNSGGWRATWGGEGGGVLLNQCPHQLDLMQWLFGVPTAVRAFCQFGKHHDIEVEDNVTAFLEYENGATGVFTTTTGEAPGTNRLEIATDNSLLIYDTQDEFFTITWNDKSVTDAINENPGFQKPGTRKEQIAISGQGGQHIEVLQNFAAAILKGEPLIAPAAEGLQSVELCNAMLLSTWQNKTVTLPISARSYATRLKKLVDNSRFAKTVEAHVVEDMSSSF
ncbi:MAG: Gfo/Idh/MocA family oxidoreductase [Pseudomonadales bacterium]|jgi:predicted dehydrogenase